MFVVQRTHVIGACQAVIVSGARYRDMITQFFLPKLGAFDVADM